MANKAKKKKPGKYTKPVLITILVLLVATLIIFILQWNYNRSRFILYPEFGITLPAGYQIHGIDVSKYQLEIGWEQVIAMKAEGAGVGFAFIKATEGLENIDPFFRKNWRGARQAGLVRGAYHFFIPAKSGKAQAENFLEMVKLQKGDLPPVLDIEHTYGAPAPLLQQHLKDWLDAIERVYRVKPIIYTNINFYRNFLAGKFDDYPLWIAHYLAPRKPRISRPWSFWQHNERGRVNGINGNVDFNVFNGDSTEFQNLLIR